MSKKKNEVRDIIGVALSIIGLTLLIKAGLDMIKELNQQVDDLLNKPDASDSHKSNIIDIKNIKEG